MDTSALGGLKVRHEVIVCVDQINKMLEKFDIGLLEDLLEDDEKQKEEKKRFEILTGLKNRI